MNRFRQYAAESFNKTNKKEERLKIEYEKRLFSKFLFLAKSEFKLKDIP